MFWNRNDDTSPIGLLAGEGEFPLLFAKAAFSLKKPLIVFGLEGYTDKRIADFARETHYVQMGQLGAVVDLLKKTNVKRVVLAGAIPKKEIYNPRIKMDDTVKGIMGQIENRGDNHILKAFEFYLKTRHGISIVDSRLFLKEMLATRGVLTRRAPTEEERQDLKFGFEIAKGIGKLDIGQTVVVKRGTVLAVEALEGTDAAIRRGGELGKGDVVVVKVAKPNQDLRFDPPCIGPETVESLKSGASRVLGIEAGKTIILSKEKVIEAADSADITIVGL
ncbi:MAG: LpxI family protein [Candidatus Omnitrophota bacterium]